jgi:DNA-binding winged helix-turn-helix (wHTH) protein/Tol biopolymer transport system component
VQDVSPFRSTLRFSDFEVDLRAGELRKQGAKVKLQEQPFQVLQILLEKPGELVSRGELQRRIWPADTFVDFDHGLYNAIKRLRETLGDTADTPRFIETLPKRGYRFVGTLDGNGYVGGAQAQELSRPTGADTRLLFMPNKPSPAPEAPPIASGRLISRGKWVWAASLAALLAAAAVIIWWIRPPAEPVVEAVTQLTDDGLPKQGPLLTDGARIYFNEGAQGSWKIVQVSATGGETSVVSSALANPQLVDLAPDESFLLVSAAASNTAAGELWTVPLPAGNPRPLGDIVTRQAAFFPDGRIVYANGNELYAAEKDGSGVHKLLALPDSIYCPSVSPNGKQIVLRTSPLTGYGTSNTFVEVAADGSGSREILRSRKDAILGCAGWSLDAKYLIYGVYHPGKSDIWALPSRTRLAFGDPKPIQLTNGPLSYGGLAQSPRDAKRMFAIGAKDRGELVRYDIPTKHFIPILSGISATDPTFSRDGNWVAYLSFPDHTLWRSRADGSDRLQLTYPPMEVELPVISQDGRKVAFRTPQNEVYLAAMDGGPLRKIDVNNAYTGTVSPDGNSMALTVFRDGARVRGHTELQVLDLRNGVHSGVPLSQGLAGVFWVNPETLVAVTGDFTKIMAFNFKTTQWTSLASDHLHNWMPSPDGKYMYYATAGTEPEAKRVRVSDGQVENLVSLNQLRRVDNHGTTQISVAPDGSPVFTRDIGTEEIYALTIKWP